MHILSLLFLAFLWLLSAASPGQSLSEVEIFAEHPAATEQGMTLDQVRSQRFEPKAKDLLNFDYTSSIYWLRFNVSQGSGNSETLVLEIPTSWLDRVTLYGPGTEETLGDTLPSPQPKAFRYPTFFLKVPPGQTIPYYLRVKGEDALVLPLNLTTVPAFYENALARAYGLGAYAGLILVLTLYNFIVYVSLRDRNYLFYVLYILAMGVMQALYEGFGTQYLWHQNTWLANRMLAFGTYLPMFFALLFTLGFLEVKQRSRRMTRLLQTVFVVLLMLSMTAFLSHDYSSAIQMASLTSFLFPILLIAIGVMMLRKSSRAARFYLLAWIPLLGSVLVYVLALRGVLPANALTTNAIYYGSALESILLSLALADRMKTLIRKQSQLTAQLDAAECVQKSLIFDKADIPGLTYSSYYRSADITGGDWYGLFDDPKNKRSYILIGDVTGHGIPSALVTGAVAGAAEVAVHMIADQSRPLLDSLHAIAEELNRVVLKTGQAAGEMMTMALIVIDRESLQAAYVNCGHTHICVASKGKVKARLEPGSLLGSKDLITLGKEFRMEEGDVLFIFTDGLLENHAFRKKPIRWKSIAQILAQQSEPQVITQNISELVQKTTAGESLQDDCTFLAIRIQDARKNRAS
ncbi:MAG TPA: 7TM diverse intracellular signaling domain-containing protein [Oligoflexus sp.]|uniref:7TM diverse intracellular signaling domain-containing protein n=1 Tax=Oligoflexus sp. TaxID=1971216 RepID=UPI002D803CBE|nr:7TM diverse intracellular signaling domain-containing protein [Oligoflexus sp.]HET9236742.1 7TM diverse intracellular signaling domain-containing protein [Oligoflexus sp.]